MCRKRVLAISTMAAFMTLSGMAHAGPGITDTSYWPNEVGPSSYNRTAPTGLDSYRARAMQDRRVLPSTQVAPEGYSGPQRCRYLGGPKYPMTC
jgi:hypothetical protein